MSREKKMKLDLESKSKFTFLFHTQYRKENEIRFLERTEDNCTEPELWAPYKW